MKEQTERRQVTQDKIDLAGLTPQEINYLIAKIRGYKFINKFDHQIMVSNKRGELYDFNPCENWNHGGVIISEFKLDVKKGDLVGTMRKFVLDQAQGKDSVADMMVGYAMASR